MSHQERRERRRTIADFVRARSGTREAIVAAQTEFGVRYGFVMNTCREFKVPIVDNRKEREPDPRTVVVRKLLLTTKLTLKEISRRCGVSRQWVSVVYRQLRNSGEKVHVLGKPPVSEYL